MMCVSRSAYLCFLCQKRLCDCLPYTTGSTRYQRHLTSQIHCNGMRAYQFTASINDEVNEAFWVSVEEALVFSLLLSLSLPSPTSLSQSAEWIAIFACSLSPFSLYAKEIEIDILWWSAAKNAARSKSRVIPTNFWLLAADGKCKIVIVTSRKFSFNFCMVFCSINPNSLTKTEKYSKHFLNRKKCHWMRIACQVRLPYKLIVIFCVLCIARECQSIAYIGNLTKSRTFFIHNFYVTDTFWKDSVQYNGDAIVLGVFFFYYRHKCLFLHSLTYSSI